MSVCRYVHLFTINLKFLKNSRLLTGSIVSTTPELSGGLGVGGGGGQRLSDFGKFPKVGKIKVLGEWCNWVYIFRRVAAFP